MNSSLTGFNLTTNDIYQYATSSKTQFNFKIAPSSKEEMIKSHNYVLKISAGEKSVYGINTGFGALSNVSIPRKDLNQLQVNLIRSHCVGVGKPYDKQTTR